MFVFNRSALPVLLPLALLVAVVLWSNRGEQAQVPMARSAPVAQGTDQRTDQGTTLASVARPQSKNGG